MKKITLVILSILCICTVLKAQQLPPYNRTNDPHVLVDRNLMARYFLAIPRGPVPSFPASVADSVKCKALWLKTTAGQPDTLKHYDCSTGHWLTISGSGAGGAFVPLTFTADNTVTLNGHIFQEDQTGPFPALHLHGTEGSDGRATVFFSTVKGNKDTVEFGYDVAGRNNELGIRHYHRIGTVDMLESINLVDGSKTFYHGVNMINLPDTVKTDTLIGLGANGKFYRTSTFTQGLGIVISGHVIKTDTSFLLWKQRQFVNQSSFTFSVENGKSIQLLPTGGFTTLGTSSNSGGIPINRTGSTIHVDIYSSTNGGATFTLIASNAAVPNGSAPASGQFILYTDVGVSPVLPLVYPSNVASPGGITALTGDVTASGSGSVAATLAIVNSNVGSFTNANVTVNAKGLITAVSNGSGGSGTNLQWINVLDYGAVGDSTTDNTTAIRAAVAAIPAKGGILYFPPGQYLVTDTIHITKVTTVLGFGGTGPFFGGGTGGRATTKPMTSILSNSLSKYTFVVDVDACQFYNIAFYNTNTSSTPTAGGAILFNKSTSMRMEDVSVYYYYKGADVENGLYWQIKGCHFIGCVSNLLTIRDLAVADEGDQRITDCYFTGGIYPNMDGIIYTSGGGLHIDNPKFNWTGGNTMRHCIVSAMTGNTVDFSVTHGSFENFSGYGIAILPNSGITNTDINLNDNQFTPGVSSTSYNIIQLGNTSNAPSNITVVGNVFHSLIVGSGTGGSATGFNIWSSASFSTIGPNQTLTYDSGGAGNTSNENYYFYSSDHLSLYRQNNFITIPTTSSVNVDLKQGNDFLINLTANTSITVNTTPFPTRFILRILQDGTGGHAVTWASGTNLTGLQTVNPTANGYTVASGYYDPATGNVEISILNNNFLGSFSVDPVAGVFAGNTYYNTGTNTIKYYTGSTWQTIGSGASSVNAISGTSNANGATISGGALTLTPADATNGGVVTNTSQVFSGIKTLTTPVLTGLPTGTGVAYGATASTLMSRDANANARANNLIEGYTTTVTAAGVTFVSVSSTRQQYFTGTTTQTVGLPDVTTLVLGQQYQIINNSTGSVTVQSFGSNTITVLAGGSYATFTCIAITGTTAASWAAALGGAGTVAGSSTYIQYNNSGAFGASSNFTYNPSTQKLFLSGQNYNSFQIDAGRPSITLSSIGTSFASLGSGNSSHITGTTDLSLIGTGNVSIEGTNVFIYGTPQLGSIGYMGYSANTNYIKWLGNGSGEFMQFVWPSNTVNIGNAGLVLSSPQTASDFTFTGSNFTFGNTTLTQAGQYAQFNSTDKALILNGGGSFTSTGDRLQVTGNFLLAAAGNKLKITEGTNGSVGQIALVAGTKAITISGVTTSSRAFITLVSQGGTTTTTQSYEGMCTSNTLTINAVTNAGTNSVNTSDTSTLNYIIIN